MTRSARLLGLVSYLSGRRSRTIADIASQFEVSERTAYRDVAELSVTRIPIYRDDFGYRLLETATLRPMNLTAEEHGLLKVALHNPALRRQDGLRRTLDALEAKLDAASNMAEDTPRALQLASLDHSGPNAAHALEPLRRAVKDKQSVEIFYASLSGGDEKWRQVDPYRVFQRDGAWYLAGRCALHGDVRIFRLDRVAQVRPLDERFEPSGGFDLDDFLESSWRLVRGNHTYDVFLIFDHSLGPLLLNARHHPGEKVEENHDGFIKYRVRLSSLDEIARWIVGFGGKVRVVAPERLRRKVKRLAHEILDRNAEE